MDCVTSAINWNDDDGVIEFTLQQKKEEQYQFKIGVAVLSRFEIDRLNNLHAIHGSLSYERSPLEDNPYHGNLLIKNDVPKSKRKMIAAAIALTYSQIVKRNNM